MIGRQMLIMLVFISMAHCSYGQEDSLALTQAIEYTLENNFQIRITQNISDIAEKTQLFSIQGNCHRFLWMVLPIIPWIIPMLIFRMGEPQRSVLRPHKL